MKKVVMIKKTALTITKNNADCGLMDPLGISLRLAVLGFSGQYPYQYSD